jgi:glutaredoxin-related protein
MTDYNQKKVEAIKLITKLVEMGKMDEEEIGYHVIKATGFGELFVKKFINVSISMGQFKRDKSSGVIKIPEVKKEKEAKE